MCSFEGILLSGMAQWLSWLERRPVTAKVVGSSPIWVASLQFCSEKIIWDLSSAGRASALQAEGHRFEPYRSHFMPMWLNWQSSWFVISRLSVRVRSSACIFIMLYGWFPEWPKGTDCKSAGNAFGGSNPPPSIFHAGVAELADAQDLKSCGTYTPVPVRFRSPALNLYV